MKKFTREDLLRMQKQLAAYSHSDPTISYTSPMSLTGEELMKIIGEAELILNAKVHPTLSSNIAWLIEKDLFVSKGAYDCLADEDTSLETLKGLEITVIPEFSKISTFDTKNDLPY